MIITFSSVSLYSFVSDALITILHFPRPTIVTFPSLTVAIFSFVVSYVRFPFPLVIFASIVNDFPESFIVLFICAGAEIAWYSFPSLDSAASFVLYFSKCTYPYPNSVSFPGSPRSTALSLNAAYTSLWL